MKVLGGWQVVLVWIAGLIFGFSLGLTYSGVFDTAKHQYKDSRITASFEIRDADFEDEVATLTAIYFELVSSIALSSEDKAVKARDLVIITAGLIAAGQTIMRGREIIPAPLIRPKPSKQFEFF